MPKCEVIAIANQKDGHVLLKLHFNESEKSLFIFL